jgi:predicted nucleic acid-binding protein
VTARYLIDKSAFVRMQAPSVRAVLEPLIQAGEVATCGVVNLEILYSAQRARDFRIIRLELEQALDSVPMRQEDFERATDVMEALAARGQHRAVNLPDLLIAAAAERAGFAVLHYDEDFDRIAGVTDQPVRWVVPRGSV